MPDPSPAALIDARIAELGDWRGATLARARELIHRAVPDVVETWKWRGVPTWEHGGILCTGETYRDKVKLTFAKGASLDDPTGLFNAGLDGNVRRAVDLHEGDRLPARPFTALVRAAAARNASAGGGTAKSAGRGTAKSAPTLLAGGNPQIAKGYGDEPVAAFVDALSGWKQEVTRRIDAVVTKAVPRARKAVKWNSPMYGIPGQGWILNVHVFTRSVKVTFFQGASLDPEPPGRGKDPAARWIDVREGALDEPQLARWAKQAAKLPGWLTQGIA
ncbi:MAG: DUF1801 domain-containing protein [Actinobacteria bacterium]|nr:DUF1801 domain-containing protein [Actinomycetota bacterium]